MPCSVFLADSCSSLHSSKQWLPPQPVRAKYFDAERDEIFLEDESGRVRLVGDALQPHSKGGRNLRSQVVTGVVVGVLGTETKSGDFEVADLVFPEGCSRLAARRTTADEADAADARGMQVEGDDSWVAMVSGLEVGADEQIAESSNGEGPSAVRPHSELKLMMLSEWLSGELGTGEVSMSAFCPRVVQFALASC